MTGRGMILVGVSSALALAVAMNVLQIDIDGALDASDETIAMAPISLGNPAAAAALQTRHLPKPSAETEIAALPTTNTPITYNRSMEVGKGDTLAALLDRAGVGRQEAHNAVVALSKHYDPRRIRRGQDIELTFQTAASSEEDLNLPAESFIGLKIDPDYKTEVLVYRNEDGSYNSEEREKELTRTPVRAEGRIENSLYVAGRDSDVPSVVIARMIRLLSWDVDFQRDIRTGDDFQVMYERVSDANGTPVYNGAVKFVTLTLSGKRISVYRYTLPDGSTDYFDESGKASRKALMRTPIDGARLSSTFGKRKHPILGYTKMHKGVDFAAPRGTPIFAAGNGTVIRAGRNGSFGNYIKIRHNGTYETAYAHLKGFARGVRSGKRVEQGQVIGYVGTTGRSTGPHLHYEVHRGGRQVNPLRIDMPSGRTLKGKELARFLAFRKDVDRTFAKLGPTEVATTSFD